MKIQIFLPGKEDADSDVSFHFNGINGTRWIERESDEELFFSFFCIIVSILSETLQLDSVNKSLVARELRRVELVRNKYSEWVELGPSKIIIRPLSRELQTLQAYRSALGAGETFCIFLSRIFFYNYYFRDRNANDFPL